MTLPAVSLMCLTYARPHMLEEAIQSFLLQDYEGEKQLVVLNDLPEQTLIFDHPQVKVVNLDKRFKTIGEKRNASAALCDHGVLGVWDDDDIFLPHRLSYSIKMKADKRYFKPTRAFFLCPNGNLMPMRNWFCCNALWDKDLFNEVGGYTEMNSGQDADLELKFKKLLGSDIDYEGIRINDIYYLYRYKGNSYHLSVFGKDKEGEPTGEEKVYNFVQEQMKYNRVRKGNVILRPHWNADYVSMVKSTIARRFPNG